MRTALGPSVIPTQGIKRPGGDGSGRCSVIGEYITSGLVTLNRAAARSIGDIMPNWSRYSYASNIRAVHTEVDIIISELRIDFSLGPGTSVISNCWKTIRAYV